MMPTRKASNSGHAWALMQGVEELPRQHINALMYGSGDAPGAQRFDCAKFDYWNAARMDSYTAFIEATRVRYSVRLVRSVSNVDKKLSIAALSQQLPLRLMLHVMPCSFSSSWNRLLILEACRSSMVSWPNRGAVQFAATEPLASNQSGS
jgi:hypothetical protein